MVSFHRGMDKWRLPTYLPTYQSTNHLSKELSNFQKEANSDTFYIHPTRMTCENMMLNELFLSQKDTRHMISLIPSRQKQSDLWEAEQWL